MTKSMKKKLLGIITARSGSRGIPKKNIKNFCGEPLIAHTIKCAKLSEVFDRIVVSTDDIKIAKISKSAGAEVPFLRPKKLAKDNTPTLPVIQHTVKWLKEKESYWADYTMILQPTSPLRQPFHIVESVRLFLKTNADSVLGVCKVPDIYTPFKAMIIDKGCLKLFDGKPIYKRTPRRQDIKMAYFSNGAIYLFKTKLLFSKKNPNFYGEKTVPYIMDDIYSVDIDTEEDWEKAEGSYVALKRSEE